MQDLAQIHALNAKAIADNIPALRAKGHWVVVEYAGLSVTGCENFSGEGAQERAEAKLHEVNSAGASVHGEIFPPTDGSAEVTLAGPGSIAPADAATADHLAERLGVCA
jgi:hypothetical protein